MNQRRHISTYRHPRQSGWLQILTKATDQLHKHPKPMIAFRKFDAKNSGFMPDKAIKVRTELKRQCNNHSIELGVDYCRAQNNGLSQVIFRPILVYDQPDLIW